MNISSKMNKDPISTQTYNDFNTSSRSLENGAHEEEDLTNLAWLTELRNQSLNWSNAFNITTEEDEKVPNLSEHYLSVSSSMSETQESKSIGIKGKHAKVRKQGLSSSTSCLYQRQQQQDLNFKRPTPSERFKTFVEKIKRDLLQYEQSAVNYQTNAAEKPPFNYSHIIGMAMLENGRVTLQQICAWIEAKFAFFRTRKKWNNSIRHNLSLHHCFRKIDRSKYEKGKGGYWELGVDPKKCDRKRIRIRKTNKNKNSNINAKIQKNECLKEIEQNTEKIVQTAIEAEQQYETIDLNQIPKEPSYLTDQSLIHVNNESQQQYHLGTIIISTSATRSDITASDMEVIENYDLETLKQLNIYSDIKESALLTENLMISPSMNIETSMTTTDSYSSLYMPIQNESINIKQNSINSSAEYVPSTDQQPNVIVEQVYPPLMLITDVGDNGTVDGSHTGYCDTCSDSSSTAVLTTESNINLSNIVGGLSDNFRPYIDGIEEAFQYLRSIDQSNRNEDSFDNILDISVSDY